MVSGAEIKVSLSILGNIYKLSVPDEHQEEIFRRAGKVLNEQLLALTQKYRTVSVQDILVKLAVEAMARTFDLDSKAAEQAEKFKQLNTQLERAIDKLHQ
jgi:cell division protein ZapA (FtsZ GTPase activity inhibitor)